MKKQNKILILTTIFLAVFTILPTVLGSGATVLPTDYDVIDGQYDPEELDLEDAWYNEGTYFTLQCLVNSYLIRTQYWAGVEFYFPSYYFDELRIEFTTGFSAKCVYCYVFYTDGTHSTHGKFKSGTHFISINSHKMVDYVYMAMDITVWGYPGVKYFKIDYCNLYTYS